MIAKANKSKKIQQKNTCTIDLKTLNKYKITVNGATPASESYLFGHTGK